MELGHLESALMEVLWRDGEGNVRDVTARLERPLAYTTVMTTLDRLYKKGLLHRRKQDRAFYYAPRIRRHEWVRQVASSLVSRFFGRTKTSPDLLASCLLDAAAHDPDVLAELEKKIIERRRQLEKGSSE